MTNPPVTHERVEEIRRKYPDLASSSSCLLALRDLLSAYDQEREAKEAALKALEPFAEYARTLAEFEGGKNQKVVSLEIYPELEHDEGACANEWPDAFRRAAELTGIIGALPS